MFYCFNVTGVGLYDVQESGFCFDWNALQLAEPDIGHCIARHAPVATGGEVDGSHLRAIGQTGAFELLCEEPFVEDL